MIRRRAIALAMAGCLCLSAVAEASTRYQPRLAFRTIATRHFDIHFHQGLETQARRLAVIAERVASKLDATLGPASGRVHVILVDQTDLSNGWATPLPYNVIEIAAAAPAAASQIGNTDDWLELVFTHEYTHVVHLSRSKGWIGGLRRVFGRMPLLFPNVYTPLWQIEGLATFEESASTGQGRVPAPDFRAILRQGAAASRFEPIDRANGGLVDWPSGTTPYLYGAYFHEYLASRYGEKSLRELTDATAGRIPYFGAPAFKRVFGKPLGDLWEEFGAQTRRDSAPVETSAARLTHHGFTVSAPRFAADGRLFYSVVNPHGFPALLALPADGGQPRHVTHRYLGNGIAFAGPLVVFDQVDVEQHVGLESDLYAAPMDGGGSWRLTRGARAAEPDVSPDGAAIVCTVQRPDRRELAIVRLPASRGQLGLPEALVSEADTHFNAPRWSTDGRWIAAERTRKGATAEIVLVDPVAKRVVRTIASAANGRNVSPEWLPDGRVAFASDRNATDRGARAFQIFAADIDSLETMRLEGTGATAQSPDVSPDGRTLAFVGYTPDGYDLFSMPLASARWVPVQVDERKADPAGTSPSSYSDVTARHYSAWRSLAPRFWTPTLESDADEVVVGAATGSADALGRHVYFAQAGWASSRARPDWQIAYAYDRWWPTLYANVSDDTDPLRGGLLRSTEVDAGLLLPFRRVRRSQSLLAALHASTDSFTCDGCEPAVDQLDRLDRLDRRAIRTGWSIDAARSFGYSISTEEGWRALIETELSREALGSDADSGAAAVDLRGYLETFPRHGVLAARVAAATSWGDRDSRRVFSAAGSEPPPGGFRFGLDAIGLMRGVDEDDLVGPHAAVVNVDYRVPLMRIDRGAGTWPLFARALHGALFVDAGSAWTARFDRDDIRVSMGAELSMDAVVGFVLPVTLTTGIAWRESPAGERGVAVFGRIGRAF